jgi:hypothetical protein
MSLKIWPYARKKRDHIPPLLQALCSKARIFLTSEACHFMLMFSLGCVDGTDCPGMCF